jgi:putative transposase
MRLPQFFSSYQGQREKTDEALIAALYQEIGLQHGFVYLVAILDWFSRYVLSWEVSITLDTSFCLEALDQALRVATPEIFNSDQGVQFTSTDFTKRLEAARIRISWDGKGRAFDNIFVERLWRTVKYEEVFVKDYQTVPEAVSNLRDYFTFYHQERFHQALGYQTPAQVYTGAHHLVGQLRAQRQHAEQQGGNV